MKTSVLTFILAFSALFGYHGKLAAQGATCATAIAITSLPFNQSNTTCGKVDNFSSASATDPCGSLYSRGEDIFYSYTPATSHSASIALGNTLTWTAILIYTGCPTAGGTCLMRAEATGGNPSIASVSFTAGVTYYIVVDTYPPPACTAFDISVNVKVNFGESCANNITLYPNTVCEDWYSIKGGSARYGYKNTITEEGVSQAQAPFIAPAGTAPASTCGATDATQPGTWASFKATNTSHTITNEGTAANDYAVYRGTCTALVQQACATLAAGGNTTLTGLTVGTTYYVFISATATSGSTNASLCLTGATAYSNPNNTCASAFTALDGVAYSLNNANATADLTMCSGSVENNIWVKWTCPAGWAGGPAYFHIYGQECNSTQGMQTSVWTAATCANVGTTCATSSNPQTTADMYLTWTPTIGSTYYINLDGYNGTACNFWGQVNSTPVTPVLPIELLAFTATYENYSVILEWATASQKNNSFFTVERSKDGVNFEEVEKINGAGTVSYVVDYLAYDKKPYQGISYYRLKQTDLDGRFTYSSIVSVNVTDDAVGNLVLMQNPVDDQLQFSFISNFKGSSIMYVYDMAGRQIHSQTLQTNEGYNSNDIDVSSLPKGLYYITIINDRKVFKSKILKN